MYKRVRDVPLPWTYEDIMDLPVFMKEQIYKNMDEFIEEENKALAAAQNR